MKTKTRKRKRIVNEKGSAISIFLSLKVNVLFCGSHLAVFVTRLILLFYYNRTRISLLIFYSLLTINAVFK